MGNAQSSRRSSPNPHSGKTQFLHRPVFQIALVAILGIIVYSNTFGVPFQFDDGRIITDSKLIKDLSNIPLMFAGGTWPFASRPLMHATLALNYHFGGLDPAGYHAVNLVFHLINGILLYYLVVMTGGFLGYDEDGTRQTAFLASLLFVVHPVQTEGVTYVVSRSMLFATTFYLSGIMFFAKAVTSERRKGFFVAALAITSFLGMASRENFATFPVMLVLYDLFFISRFRLREAAGHWKVYMPVFLSLGYMAFLVANNTYDRRVDYPGLGVPSINYFFTQFKVQWTYLRLLALPVNQNIDYDYPTSWILFGFRTLLPMVGYLCLWAMAIVFARKRPVISFCLLWFLVALIPISFGVTFTDLGLDDVILEHRLYLPSAGIIVAAASCATIFIRRLRGRQLLATVTAAAIVLSLLAGASYKRNAVWGSGISLWTDATEKSPRKARPYYNLGLAYAASGAPERAIESFSAAIMLRPDYDKAYNNLGVAYYSLGMYKEAIESLRAAVEIRPDYARAHGNLAAAYSRAGLKDAAEEQLRIAETLVERKED